MNIQQNQQPFNPQYGNVPQPPPYGSAPARAPRGGFNRLLIPLTVSVLTLLCAVIFGIWAFAGMQDYKNNVDSKVQMAVTIAQEQTATAKDAEFLEKEKAPLKSYKTAQAVGSIAIQYPKTWSGFVTENNDTNTPVDGYFHPGYVPGLNSGTDFALRLKVISTPYADYMKQFEAKAKSGKLTISPYKAPKMPDGTLGSRIDGEINTGQQGSVVVFPLRDKTIAISSESAQFKGDFDGIIMANMTFVP